MPLLQSPDGTIFGSEDAAQAIMAGYKGRASGALGDLGSFSFH
jgi:dTDP-4-amino-4,6-dideoxygalactose transaminase